MTQVGTIREIWRYPVKGMAGEKLDSAHFDENGITGDRRWALRDVARAEIQSCKARPALLQCRAIYRDDGGVDVCFPDGSRLGSDDPAMHTRLSALTGHASTLEALRAAEDVDFFRRHKGVDGRWLDELVETFAREPGEPLPDFLTDVPAEAADFVAAPGSFFLVTPVHLLTTATLAHLATLNPRADWDVRRFRPNIVIDTPPDPGGLIEQDWLGRQLMFGNVSIDCVGTTPRCGVITRAQEGCVADTDILRTVVRDAAQNVGIYGATRASGTLRVGDVVTLV